MDPPAPHREIKNYYDADYVRIFGRPILGRGEMLGPPHQPNKAEEQVPLYPEQRFKQVQQQIMYGPGHRFEHSSRQMPTLEHRFEEGQQRLFSPVQQSNQNHEEKLRPEQRSKQHFEPMFSFGQLFDQSPVRNINIGERFDQDPNEMSLEERFDQISLGQRRDQDSNEMSLEQRFDQISLEQRRDQGRDETLSLEERFDKVLNKVFIPEHRPNETAGQIFRSRPRSVQDRKKKYSIEQGVTKRYNLNHLSKSSQISRSRTKSVKLTGLPAKMIFQSAVSTIPEKEIRGRGLVSRPAVPTKPSIPDKCYLVHISKGDRKKPKLYELESNFQETCTSDSVDVRKSRNSIHSNTYKKVQTRRSLKVSRANSVTECTNPSYVTWSSQRTDSFSANGCAPKYDQQVNMPMTGLSESFERACSLSGKNESLAINGSTSSFTKNPFAFLPSNPAERGFSSTTQPARANNPDCEDWAATWGTE